jgi:hypothetical protein
VRGSQSALRSQKSLSSVLIDPERPYTVVNNHSVKPNFESAAYKSQAKEALERRKNYRKSNDQTIHRQSRVKDYSVDEYLRRGRE